MLYYYVYFAANIALNKVTNQSSTSGDYSASLAVDQNSDGVLADGTCSQTEVGEDQWWAVDLEQEYVVGKVTIFTRADCCGK